MANSKKVYFYRIKLKDKNTNKSLDKNDVLRILKGIPKYNTKDKPFVFVLNDDKDNTIIEFLNVQDYEMFGRTGKKEDLNYLHFRSKNNKKSQNIDVPTGLYAEKFTYFYYNLDTGILAFLFIQGAPRYNKFEVFLNQLCNDQYEVSVVAVSNDNVIDLLKGKDAISSFSLKTSVPIDDFLGCDNLNLSRNAFVELENAESIEIILSVKGKRRKNISKKSGNDNPLFKLIDTVRGGVPNVEARMHGGNKDEKSQTYNVLEEYFTYNVDLPNVKEDTLFTNEMKDILKSAYDNVIGDILKMVR